jgi:hypothetical protein
MAGSVLDREWVLGDGVPGLAVPQVFGVGGLLYPNEMAALSWNFNVLLLLSSGEYDPDDPYALYDPNDPSTAQSEGKCSFLQPWYCSSIHSFFEIRTPDAEVVTPPDAIRGGGRRGVAAAGSARIPGRPATPDPSVPSEPTRTVDPQIFRPVLPGTRSPILPTARSSRRPTPPTGPTSETGTTSEPAATRASADAISCGTTKRAEAACLRAAGFRGSRARTPRQARPRWLVRNAAGAVRLAEVPIGETRTASRPSSAGAIARGTP